jgi:two-component system LytT family sensor kinase
MFIENKLMKISLPTFLIVCLCSLNLFAQPNEVIDTAKIKPAEILNNEYNYVCGWDKRSPASDYFRLNIRDYGVETYEGLTVTIKETPYDFIYHVYLQNLKTKDLEFVSNRWVEDESKHTASLFVGVKYFKDAMEYKLLIIPTLKTAKGVIHIESKSVKIFNAAAFFARGQYSREIGQIVVKLFTLMILFPPIFFGIKNMKAVKAERQKEKAQLQLDAVRSQLNPHFLFNALAGIQTLMNTNQTEQANRYLTRFSRLTRAVLKSTDLISLDEERNLLDDYLQMEQLRFNFKYQITIDPNLDIDNIEIPSMLLQPFIENAVKHGVASLNSVGQINIIIFKTNDDLILKIEDNGKGFDTSKINKGLGFDLSTKRIALLNKIYIKDPIVFSVQSKPGKTTVAIILTKWL